MFFIASPFVLTRRFFGIGDFWGDAVCLENASPLAVDHHGITMKHIVILSYHHVTKWLLSLVFDDVYGCMVTITMIAVVKYQSGLRWFVHTYIYIYIYTYMFHFQTKSCGRNNTSIVITTDQIGSTNPLKSTMGMKTPRFPGYLSGSSCLWCFDK